MKKIQNLFGTLGAIFFAICAYPQVYQVWTTRDTAALSGLFLVFWALGEVFTWTYVILDNKHVGRIQWPLHVNYLLNSISLMYLIWMKFFI